MVKTTLFRCATQFQCCCVMEQIYNILPITHQHLICKFFTLFLHKMMKLLTKRIKEKGLTLHEFCKNHLKTEYRTFQYRMKTNHYYPAEVVYICMFINDSCENIFGRSFQDLVMLSGPHEIRELAIDIINLMPDRYNELFGSVKPIDDVKLISKPPNQVTKDTKNNDTEFSFIDIDLFNPLDESRNTIH